MSEVIDDDRADFDEEDCGIIHYVLYAQDGSMIPMTCADTPANRRFVEWVKIHDRYTVTSVPQPRLSAEREDAK